MLASVLSSLSAVLAKPVDALSPITGETTLGVLLLDWLPLIAAAVLPVLCLPFVALGICGGGGEDGGGKLKFGMRTALKGMMIAVRADIRMGNETKHTQLLKKAGFVKGGPSWMKPTGARMQNLSAGARKSPDQTKAKMEEQAIKGKTGKSRFY